MRVSLREVRLDDLPVFFEHQRDPEAVRMASFASREHEAFMTHWRKVLADSTAACRTIIADGHVVGNVGAWTDATTQARLVGYWIGRAYWGRGVATAALREFLGYELHRPLLAHVVKHNIGSVRVLEKCGFAIVGDETTTEPDGTSVHEWILRLTGPGA